MAALANRGKASRLSEYVGKLQQELLRSTLGGETRVVHPLGDEMKYMRHVCVPGYGEPGSSARNGSTTEAGPWSRRTLESRACDMLVGSHHCLRLHRTEVSSGVEQPWPRHPCWCGWCALLG
jgi:hypothetical protein